MPARSRGNSKAKAKPNANANTPAPDPQHQYSAQFHDVDTNDEDLRNVVANEIAAESNNFSAFAQDMQEVCALFGQVNVRMPAAKVAVASAIAIAIATVKCFLLLPHP